MTSMINEFYYFPEFQIGQVKKLLLLQVDIEGHSKLSKEMRPADVMKMKVELAELLGDRLKADGYKGMGWQGDGGMFALDVSDNVTLLDKAASSWRSIRHAAEIISKRYPHLFKEGVIPLRASAHVCSVNVHPDPRYWHAEGINEFAKAERDIGIRDNFMITGELYRELPEEAKQEFELFLQSVTVGQRSDVYRFSAGVPGDRNMDFIPNEMKAIEREVKSFRSSLRAMRQYRGNADLNPQAMLIIVDLQQDFAGDRPLAVPDSEKIASANHQLAMDAVSSGVTVIATRDWHPSDHFSFQTWPRHCVAEDDGAKFIPAFKYETLQQHVQLANIGADNEKPDYNPYCDQDFYEFMLDRAPEAIYVTGIALEYCVLATCLASQAYSTKVIALEDYIQSAKADKADFAWSLLDRSGVTRKKGNPFISP